MPIFGEASTPFDEIVEKVTAETLTTENWALMMDICDDVSSKGPKACKYCLISIKKRLNHRDPHVILLALSLLDCLWNNCGTAFRREVSSKEFINELSYKATSSNRVIGEKTRELIKKWSDNECKKDSSLSLVESLYKDLLEEGCTFDTNSNTKPKKIAFSNDPNVVSTEEEEADIAKAIALSLNEVDGKSNKKHSQAIYPSSFEGISTNFNQKSSVNNQRQVKALYDFEAAEDNEISFTAGEIIIVLDDSDQNWWRGSTTKETGLFPASFVTADLKASVIEDKSASDISKQHPQPQAEHQDLPKVEIDEEILLKCFQLLQECDPTGEVPDSPELAYFEQMSLAQVSLIDQKLAQIDKQHNMLAQTDVAIRDVLANYDNAVQQVHYQMQNSYAPPAMSNTTMSGGNVPNVYATSYPFHGSATSSYQPHITPNNIQPTFTQQQYQQLPHQTQMQTSMPVSVSSGTSIAGSAQLFNSQTNPVAVSGAMVSTSNNVMGSGIVGSGENLLMTPTQSQNELSIYQTPCVDGQKEKFIQQQQQHIYQQ